MRFYESGGSASTLALVSAIKLGFSQVIMAGVDLAIKENQIYTHTPIIDKKVERYGVCNTIIIRKIADNGACVIVGRAADYIRCGLRERRIYYCRAEKADVGKRNQAW